MYRKLGCEKHLSRRLGSNLHNNRICFIVPSRLLEKKIKEGTPEQRDRALYTLKISQLIRGQRIANAKMRTPSVAAHEEMRREVYDMKSSENESGLPGKLVLQEGGGGKGDQDAENCFKGTGNVYKFYKEVFNRNSIDNHGMPMISSVHFGKDFDNAFWNGRQMVYGDGDDLS